MATLQFQILWLLCYSPLINMNYPSYNFCQCQTTFYGASCAVLFLRLYPCGWSPLSSSTRNVVVQSAPQIGMTSEQRSSTKPVHFVNGKMQIHVLRSNVARFQDEKAHRVAYCRGKLEQIGHTGKKWYLAHGLSEQVRFVLTKYCRI